jgi:hypothetical protein
MNINGLKLKLPNKYIENTHEGKDDDESIMVADTSDDDNNIDDEDNIDNDSILFTVTSDDEGNDNIIKKIEEDQTKSNEACKIISDITMYSFLASGTEGTVYDLNDGYITKINNRVKENVIEDYGAKYKNKIEIITKLNNLINTAITFKPNLLQTEIKFCNDTQQLVETQRFINGITLEKEITNMFTPTTHEFSIYTNQIKLNKYIIKIVRTIDFLYKNKFFHNDTHVANIMIEKNIPIIIDYGYLTYDNPLNGNYQTYNNNNKDKEILTTPFLDIGQLLNTIIKTIEPIEKINKIKKISDVIVNLNNLFKKYFVTLPGLSRGDIGINYCGILSKKNNCEKFFNVYYENQYYNMLIKSIKQLNKKKQKNNYEQKYMKYKIKYLKLKNANRIIQ